MEISLVRRPPEGDAIHGDISLDGSFFCYSLERLGVEIPKGRYSVTLYNSPRFGREVPLLHGVEGRTFIEIHSANWPKDLDGCIGVAYVRCKGYVERSKPALSDLTEKIKKAQNVFITVS